MNFMMMRTLMMALLALAICLVPAAAQVQSVGEDFGRSWLEKYGKKQVTSEGPENLWSWGGAPKGYAVSGGKLYPYSSLDQWYYPNFMASPSPIIINRTQVINDQNYISPDFLSPDFISDPWLLAQITGRPVVIRAQ
jgi:hypothetical protein